MVTLIARFPLSPKCEAMAVSKMRQSLLPMTLDMLLWILGGGGGGGGGGRGESESKERRGREEREGERVKKGEGERSGKERE